MEYDWSEIDLSQIWIELYRVCGRILKDWVLVSHNMATAGKQFMEKCNSPSFKEIITPLSLMNWFWRLKVPAG